jgi:hypothetical protein
MQSGEQQNSELQKPRTKPKNRLAKARKFKPQHLQLDTTPSVEENDGSRM